MSELYHKDKTASHSQHVTIFFIFFITFIYTDTVLVLKRTSLHSLPVCELINFMNYRLYELYGGIIII